MADPQTSALSTSTSTSIYTNCADTCHDVFINHRGPDVKNNFASHLYYRLRAHRLKPFLDREELQGGELLSPQIEAAIRTASVHITIFSPGYADSRWCLDELVLILNKHGDTIIPVFYKVKPSELRWTGRYFEALSNHEQNGRYDHQTVEKWRKALFDVSQIIGFELEAYNGDKGKLLDKVVRCVLKKGRKTGLNMVSYPTGLEENVQDLEITIKLQHPQNGKVTVLESVVELGNTRRAKRVFHGECSHAVHGEVEKVTPIATFLKETLRGVEENFNSDKKSDVVKFEGGLENIKPRTPSRERQVKKGTPSGTFESETLGVVKENSNSDKRSNVKLEGGFKNGFNLFRWMKRVIQRRDIDAVIPELDSIDDAVIPELDGIDAVIFKRKTLSDATHKFHEENKLGEGGFGGVYKGTTQDGQEIAVKRLSLMSHQGKREFVSEVKALSKIHHGNVVHLHGCCVEGTDWMLVYEYMPNQSLDKILFDPNKRQNLYWQTRYNIIMGIARGLLYLHEDRRIFHRDIKPSNILLDQELNPKIADFGLAKEFTEDQSHVTTRVAGTYGYLAPEYLSQGQLSVKADVYSFGVLLLEIISGRKNIDCYNRSPEKQMLLEWAWSLYTQKKSMDQIIDPFIIETCDKQQALRCIHVALLCQQPDASLRPPMSTTTLMLSNRSVELPDPTQPAYPMSTMTLMLSNRSVELPDSTQPAYVSKSRFSSQSSPSSMSMTILKSR